MKDQRSYFEKADFQSDLPTQLLTAALGFDPCFAGIGGGAMAGFLRISAEPAVDLHLLHDHLSRQIYADFHDISDWESLAIFCCPIFWVGGQLPLCCLPM